MKSLTFHTNKKSITLSLIKTLNYKRLKDTHSSLASTRRTHRTCKTPISHQKPNCSLSHSLTHTYILLYEFKRDWRLKLTTWNRRLSWPWSREGREIGKPYEEEKDSVIGILRKETVESEREIEIGSFVNRFRYGRIMKDPKCSEELNREFQISEWTKLRTLRKKKKRELFYYYWVWEGLNS